MRLVVLVVTCLTAIPVVAIGAEAKPDTRTSVTRVSSRLAAISPIHDAIVRSASPVVERSAAPAGRRTRQPGSGRSWIGRHPAWFGSIVGFVTGFFIGYLPGDDGVFYDFDASFNGLVIGGLGAGIGAVVGWPIGR